MIRHTETMKNMKIHQKVVTIGFLLTTGAHGLFAAEIELNVVTGSRSPFGDGQRWALELAKLKNVRPSVVGGQSRPRPDIKRRGTTTVVTAVIDSSNRLVVPGRTFSIQQRASLQNWLDSSHASKPARKYQKIVLS